MKAFLGNAVYWTILNVLILLFFINWVGKAFYNAYSYTWYYVWFYGYPGAEIYNTLPVTPTWSMLFMIPFIESFPWLAVWLSIAWVLSCFCLMPLLMYPMSRVMFAMSFDRALPSVLGELRTKFRSPIPALIASNIVGWLFTWLYCYTPVYMWTYDIATLFLITFSGVAIAGAILPYKKKELFEGSPLAKYKIFGVPLITICGIGFLPYAILVLYYYFTSPELGISFTYVPEAWYFVAAIYIACAVLYYLVKWYRRHQGIDLDLVYAEIPVE
jgi:amino acid transporter